MVILKLAKLAFVTVGCALVGVMAGSGSNNNTNNANSHQNNSSATTNGISNDNIAGVTPPPQQVLILQQALHHIPNPTAECMVRNVASRLAQSLHDQVTTTTCLWTHFVS